MHICVDKLTIFGSDNGLSPGRRQAIIWKSAGIPLIGPWGTNCDEFFYGDSNIFIEHVEQNAFENVIRKMAAILSQPQCVERRS